MNPFKQTIEPMNIVITGADGFIGKTLKLRLSEMGHSDVIDITRGTTEAGRRSALMKADCVFHLAGVNRPVDVAEFSSGNAGLTQSICATLTEAGRKAMLVLTSSTQAEADNPYGASKRGAEDAVFAYGKATGAPTRIVRLPNVFGKWARPNYNSAIATFCHNIARGIPITVNDPSAPLHIVHVDDVALALIAELEREPLADPFVAVSPVYETTVGAVAGAIYGFKADRQALEIARVGTGLIRALYATYISYLPPPDFAYDVVKHSDPRGDFVEMLRTQDSGQFSYFTSHPGITRGEHYHHSKTEKFLVIQGTAHFGFRHIVSGETHELVTQGGEPQIVDTVPGWTHNITNIGEDQLIVMLWANEKFDRQRPDTVALKVAQ